MAKKIDINGLDHFKEKENAMIASEYSSSKTYAVGDYCYHAGVLQCCTTPITTAENWTAGHWTAAKLADDCSSLKTALTQITVPTYTKLSDTINTGKYISSKPPTYGELINGAGTVTQWEYTDYVDVSNYDKVAITASCLNGRLYYCFYDSSKNAIANSGRAYEANVELNDEVVNVPDNAKYCVAMWYYSTSANDPIIKGISTALKPDGFVQYSVTQNLTEPQKAVARDNIGAVDKNDVNEIAVRKVIGKNKFNPATSVNGYIMNNAGTILPAASYNTTDFIDISEFTNSVCVSPKLRNALQYDSDLNSIAATYIGSTQNNAVITINENANYIRVTYYAADEANVQIEDGTAVSEYEPYELIPENDVNCLNPTTKAKVEELIDTKGRNVLYGKKWISFGDSFTAYTNKQFTSGVFSGKDMSYPRLIAERNGMEIDEDFFASGRTLAYPEDGSFTNSATCPTNSGYYQNVPADVDYITVMLGINDLNHLSGSGTSGDGEDQTGVITLGTIDDTGTATYYGAWNTVLGWFRANRPFAHIGIIITNGTQSQNFTEAQIAEAKKWGYPYLNLNGDERTPAFIRCYNPNMPSSLKESLKTIQGVDAPTNTHPNWQTHELESTIIEAWLRTL